ncbi:cellulose binding domain-containing protein [Anaerocolumna xylanovorans]|uniref:Cellulose binding domain-containing protein n=1 Tax=Anaerocolumna xylanovorans DSM 12503 TaxID=1121345 RepID=A0A1M7Y9Y3_9FIRM|nr:cellulose binding domain-containing protein [Anaerocolumna xylanovorans]SHO49444.1 Protein of unknown function [Anaerocolumna xylanovorans DSM 12503]
MKVRGRVKKSILSIVLVLSMLLLPFANLQANAETSETMPSAEGKTSTKAFSSEPGLRTVTGGAITPGNNKFSGNGFDVEFNITGQWEGAYNGSITIKNTGNTAIENWCISFKSSNRISNIWNASVVSYDDTIYTIKNVQWNQDIRPNESVSFGFTANGNTVDIPSAYSLLGTAGQVKDNRYSVNYIIDSDWGSGFTGRIEIINNTDKPIEDWYLEFDMENNISSIWNAKIKEHSANHYVVYNAGYNQNIAAKASVSFGFIVQSGSASKKAQNIILHSTDTTSDNRELTINTLPFVYYQDKDFYAVGSEKISSINGTLLYDMKKVKSFAYTIADENGNIIKKGDINAAKDWAIADFSLIFGINVLTVSVQDTDGTSISKSIKLACGNWDYSHGLEIDTGDTDGDGLINYLEAYYGTDKENADTDGDGLNDYVELAILNTNPLVTDTDGNGIPDSDEDRDLDKLSNKEELALGLDPAYYDSDYDTLSDYDEVGIYKTNPLQKDTDGDGASDSLELKNGTDPLTANSTFTATATYEADNQSVIPSVVVKNVRGSQLDSLTIEEVTDNPLINDKIPGYMGSAYDFNINGSFESAVISFQFDKNLLTDKTFVPAIYYYNEDQQTLEELENQTITGNAISAVTKHFSTYILLNKTAFEKVWKDDIKGPGTNAKHLRIGFVVDVSGSMSGTKLSTVKTVLNNFINILGDKDQASIIKFNSSASTVVPMTADKTALASGVNYLSANGLTAIYTGIGEALDEFSDAADVYDTIIVLTDGYDEPSVTYDNKYADLVKKAVQNKATIYTIGINTVDTALLTKIAEQTGGKYYLASVITDLEECFDFLKEETVDYTTDSNNDGISDYYTKLMCEGRLTSGSGIKLFAGQSYAAVQANSDYDGDSVPNGEEVYVVKGSDNKVYLKVNSSPVQEDTDYDGLWDSEDQEPLVWNVCDRDLAIFAALAYENGTNFVNKMYTAPDIVGADGEAGEQYYFYRGASIADQDEGISLKWKLVDYVNKWADIDTYFSASTFKNGNDIVIAYRGTNEKIGEWVNNIVGVGLLNYHSEEGHAREYALKIADRYPGCNIYITGHSLGGYLAQIGAAELLEKRSVSLEKVAYFNGIGLKYNKLLFWTKDKAMDYLKDYNNKGELISYYVKGDVVSALGVHSGQKIGFLASTDTLEHHSGNYGSGALTDFLSKSAIGWLCVFTGENLAQYYEYYHVKSVMEYFWVTHETDSFYYYLAQGKRSAN